MKFEKIHGYHGNYVTAATEIILPNLSLHHSQSIEISCLNDLCKSMMMNVLFFNDKSVVAICCYGYCALGHVPELTTGENQN